MRTWTEWVRLGPQRVISEQDVDQFWVSAADLDGDADMDVLSAFRFADKIAWYQNEDGMGLFGPELVITRHSMPSAHSTVAADMDGDGDQDVVTGFIGDEFGEVAWYENIDGRGGFGSRQVITSQEDPDPRVRVADLDNDNDLDLVVYPSVCCISNTPRPITWYENVDGNGTFGPQQVIATVVSTAATVELADIDSDGDVDLLYGTFAIDQPIVWYENTDSQGTFSYGGIVTTQAYDTRGLHAADLDGDGDLDVLASVFRRRHACLV